MKNSKYQKIILCFVLAAVLTGLYFFFSNFDNTSADESPAPGYTEVIGAPTESPAASAQSTASAEPGDNMFPKTDPDKEPVVTSYSSQGIDSDMIRWAAVPEANGYEVYRSDTKDGEYTKMNTLTDTVYTDTGLTMGKSYFYKVRAIFSSGEDTYFGPYTADFEIKPVPAAPKMFRAEFSNGHTLLTWSDVEGASIYEVYRCETPDGKFELINKVTGTSLLDKGEDITKTNYYKIRACGTAKDGSSVKGKESMEEYSVKGDITDKCTFTSSLNRGTFGDAIDNNYKTAWDSGNADNSIDISTGKNKAGGVYFVWDIPPKNWKLYGVKSDGTLALITQGGEEGYLTQFVYIPSEFAGYGKFRLVISTEGGADVSLAEISVFTPGNVPYYAPVWQPFAGRTDLLTIVAHPDDEDLYMGAPAPYYASEGKRCVTVYMTYSVDYRRYEGQESAWTLGNRNYPVMRYAEDVKTASCEDALKYWPLDDTVSYIVEQIRKYKPSVIVTHDVNGEYGHGAHMLTEYATELAFKAAGDPNQYADSAKKYGVWNAGKLYVHLYKTGALDPIDINKPLSAFGGKTDYEVVLKAYARQKSQLGSRAIPKSGDYDMRAFGLCLTNLGPDVMHETMFENVTEDAMLSLNPWYGEAALDRSSLQDALKEAESKSQTDYTAASWNKAGLTNAIAEAQGVLNDGNARQYEVEAEAAALYSDLGMLIPV